MLVNGIDDLGEDKDVRIEARRRVFKQWFREAEVRVFDSGQKQGTLFRHRPLPDEAKDIVRNLQLDPGPTPKVSACTRPAAAG